MADSTPFDFKVLESLGTILLCKIEEELVSMTYGMTRLLKQGLETQKQFQSNTEWPVDRSNTLDQMLNHVTHLINQMDQRSQSLSRLEKRLASLEETVDEPTDLDRFSRDEIANGFEIRLTAIEESLNSIDLLATELGQRNGDYASLSSRITKLEELLQGMSDPARSRPDAIANLEERLAKLEAVQLADEDVAVHAVESDRFIYGASSIPRQKLVVSALSRPSQASS